MFHSTYISFIKVFISNFYSQELRPIICDKFQYQIHKLSLYPNFWWIELTLKINRHSLQRSQARCRFNMHFFSIFFFFFEKHFPKINFDFIHFDFIRDLLANVYWFSKQVQSIRSLDNELICGKKNTFKRYPFLAL